MVKRGKLWFGINPSNWNNLDFGVIKLSIIAFTLFMVSAWPGFANWARSVHWFWFLLIFVLAAVGPLVKGWKK